MKNAIEANRIDLYLQPLVTLPQRKVRYYEAVSRLRDTQGEVLSASAFIGPAEEAGLLPRLDYMVLFRCVQVLRRLQARNKDVGLFCNIAGATLSDPEIFPQCLDFLDANRALAPSLVLEFKQSTMRSLGPVESERLAHIAQRGYRLSIDHVCRSCISSPRNWPTAACASSRCRPRSCSTRTARRRRTFIPPIFRTFSAASALISSPKRSKAKVP